MSKIDELLKDEKVEWKKLEDVCKFERGQTITKKNVVEGNIPVIAGGQKPAYYHGVSNRSGVTIAVSGSGAYAGYVSYWEQPIFLSDAFSIEPNEKLNKRYLYHWLLSVQHKIFELKQGSGIPHVYGKDLGRFKIPIPPIETQEKIVKTLDKFTECVTELQVELQAELQARVKQYEYYRDELLSEDYLKKLTNRVCNFDSKSYELKSFELNELVKIRNGKDWKNLEKGNIPVYGSGGNMDIYVNKYSYDKPTVLIPRKGSIENVFYLEEPFWNVDTIFYTEIDENKIIPKYFYYFIENFDISKLCTSSTRPSLTQSVLNKVKIDLPPLEIQSKVVEILDKFKSLISETRGLLPQEIEERQKQYEFYREKLLTFDENMIEPNRTERLLASSYFSILKEACDIVGTNLDKVNLKKLKDVTNIILGGTPTKSKKEYWENGNIPWMSSGEVNKKTIYNTNEFITKKGYDNSSATMVPSNSTVIALAGQGKTRGLVARIKINLCTNQSLATLVPKEKIINDYLYYYLEGQYIKLRESSSGDGSRGGLNKDILQNYPILVPPLYVQEYVVSILDKFDSLINDINEGLPKEIELRQKQYEYYREKLLDFPR